MYNKYTKLQEELENGMAFALKQSENDKHTLPARIAFCRIFTMFRDANSLVTGVRSKLPDDGTFDELRREGILV